VKRLYCKNCLSPIKTIRDINDYIGEEYYSRNCKCGYYNNINYHMRKYLFLEDHEIQSTKRDFKLDEILLFESYDEISQIRNKLESILEIFNSCLEDWANVSGCYQKVKGGKTTHIYLDRIEEDEYDLDNSKFVITIDQFDTILIRDGEVKSTNIDDFSNNIYSLRDVIERILEDEELEMDEDDPISIFTDSKPVIEYAMTPSALVSLENLSLDSILKDLESETREYEKTYGQGVVPYVIGRIIVRFQ
jgi:hypothetical protein